MKSRQAILIFAFVIFIGLIFGGIFTYRFLTQGFNQKISSNKESKSVSAVSLNEGPKIVEPFNLLILGIDNGLERNWQGRSDSIIFLRLIPNKKEIKALSIPRDTLTEIPGHGQDKINHAFAFGGVELSTKTVEKFIGKNVDYYVKIDMDGFGKIVDEIGGVYFNLDRKVPCKGKTLDKGMHHLNGDQALAVIRFRHEPLGDIARVKRQMRFIKAVTEQALSKGKSMDKIITINKLEENLETDLGLKDVLGVFNTFKDTKSSNFIAEVVPGNFYNYKKISYWKPDKKELSNTINKLFS